MKAIAINGSPRPGGNTEIMLKKVLEPLEAAGWGTEYRQIGGKPVRGCMACFKCFEKKNGRCVVEKDDMNHLGQTIAWLGKAIASLPDTFPIPPYDVEVRELRKEVTA